MSETLGQFDNGGGLARQFSSFALPDFVNWLDTGLRRYHSASWTEPPFGFAANYVTHSDTVVMGLGDIYRRFLPDETKPIFRVAVGKALLRGVADSDFPPAGVSSLIDLIGEIKAVESLESVPKAILAGRYGSDRRSLQHEAISVFKQLMPSPEAISALRTLASSRGFNCRYTFDALTTLCRFDSKNWVLHVANLSSRISQLYGEALRFDQGHSEARERNGVKQVRQTHGRFIQDFAQMVPADLICAGIKELEAMWTSSLIVIGGGAYDRCVELVRKLDESEGPFYLSYGLLSSGTHETTYRITLTINPGTNRECSGVADVSGAFKRQLFRQILSIHDYRDQVGSEYQSRFLRLETNLSNWRKPSEGSTREADEFSTVK